MSRNVVSVTAEWPACRAHVHARPQTGYHSTMRMNDKEAGAASLNRTLSALADPTRRAILRRLMRGEARVTELARPFSISLNAVSKHIRMLQRAGLVRRRRVWRERLVSFSPAPLDEAAAWINEQRAFWTARLDALDALLRAQDRSAAALHGKSRKRDSQKSGPVKGRSR